MKASEAIIVLQSLINEFGDKDIGIYSSMESEFEDVDSIIARKEGKFHRKYFNDVFFGISNYEIGDFDLQLSIMSDDDMKLDVKDYDLYTDSIEIEGTKYSGSLFRELGCNFKSMVGQVLRVESKEDGLVTTTRIDDIKQG